MPMIPTRPDDGTLDAVTPAVPVDGGWLERAQTGVLDHLRQTFDDNLDVIKELRADVLTHGKAMYELGRCHQAEIDKLEADNEAELASIAAARRMTVQYIRGPVGEGYIYVISFTIGVVKVGQTEDPKRRLNEHQSESLAYGVGATNFWTSPPHRNFRDNEAHLIRLCRQVSRRSKREYYHEVGYKRAVEFAWSLTFDSEIPDQLATECGWS